MCGPQRTTKHPTPAAWFDLQPNPVCTQDEPRLIDQPAGDEALSSVPLSLSPVPLQSVFISTIAPASIPEADEKPDTPEENGDAELEPMRNGAGHTSETESSDSGVTPRDKENSTGASQYVEGTRSPTWRSGSVSEWGFSFEELPSVETCLIFILRFSRPG